MLRDHSLFMAGSGLVRMWGGIQNFRQFERGVTKNMPVGWGGGHLLLNNLFTDMFIKANIYYKCKYEMAG